MNRKVITGICVLTLAVTAAGSAHGQAPAPAAAPPQGRGNASPANTVVSPEVAADRRVTFRIYAPNAQAIRLAAGDIPGVGQTTQLAKGENGIWSVTVGPIDPGAYRYNFNVDGVSTIDPRNHATSESTASSSPSACTSTDPSGSLRTHPVTPSARACSSQYHRNDTPWTRPVTRACTAFMAP